MRSENYRRKEWLDFREKCLKHANNVCERCGRSNVVLQVHHPEYIQGLKLWEYQLESCEVICRRCHAEIHGKIIPQDGWLILDSDLDHHEPSDPVPCANCDRDVEWHFTIWHPKWGETIVGSECAENLSNDPEIRRLKSYQRRLRTFLSSSRWKPTPKGFRITYERHSVLVFRQGNRFKLKIDDDWGKLNYLTELEAKAKAFAHLDFLITKDVMPVGGEGTAE
jgi:hypothetical protein